MIIAKLWWAPRLAQSEAEQSTPGNATAAQRDVKKRFMFVDNAHVIRLERNGRQITRIVTNKGTVDVPANGQVFIALGTIESTRLALTSLPNANGLIGRNLMAHLRSNVTFRVPRDSFSDALNPAIHPEARNQEASALFVKGIHTHADGSLGHFHIQITSAGVGELGMDSEADFFKKVPDIDLLHNFRDLNVKEVICTLRGIGEMVGDKQSADPRNRITLGGAPGPYDYGQPRTDPTGGRTGRFEGTGVVGRHGCGVGRSGTNVCERRPDPVSLKPERWRMAGCVPRASRAPRHAQFDAP